MKNVKDLYVKKENRFVQTDQGKYSYMTPEESQPSSYKEWTLTQNLKDAESLIQDLKDQVAIQKERIYQVEETMKKKEVEFSTVKRDGMNSQETTKRLQEQLKDSIHKNNLYQIEVEELIKQIDLADAKTREKEDDLKLLGAEYERKMKLQEERIMFRRSKQDEREVYEVKREHQIEKEEMKKKIEENEEQLDYFNQKVTKLEVENKNLRLGRDQNKRIKELENEIEILKNTQSSYHMHEEKVSIKNIQAELSKDEQVKLQRELQQVEMMLKGYQEENEKAFMKQKQLEKDLKQANEKLGQESKKVKDLVQKQMLDRKQVYVEPDEPDIDTVNNMGLTNAISQKELGELHAQLKKLVVEKGEVERDLGLKDGQFKTQLGKVRDEKEKAEKQLYEVEFLVGEKERELEKLKDEFYQDREKLNEHIKDLEEKVQWFRENQSLLNEDEEKRKEEKMELAKTKEKVKKLEEQSKKYIDLEKKCKLLEETIKSKNPNSIPMMIQAAKESDHGREKDLKQKIQRLEVELEDKDKEYEKKVRTLRQEAERVKNSYEKIQGKTEDFKKVKALESEIQTIKTYYNKRIREIEDKYKFRIEKPGNKEKDTKDIQKDNKDNEQLEQVIKERNHLAQKVINLETQNNRRRQSFQEGQMPLQLQDDQKLIFQAIYSIINLMKGLKKEDQKSQQQLLESSLACVELLKQFDQSKNKQVSQLLLQLAQDMAKNKEVNSKMVQDISDFCKKEIESSPGIKKSNSNMNINQDIQDVYQQHESPKQLRKPPLPTNNFMISPSPQTSKPSKRSVQDLLKKIVSSGTDLDRLLENAGGDKVSTSKLYQILTQEDSLKNLSIDEVKSIQEYVQQQNSPSASNLAGLKKDEIDIQDLINILLDVSLEIEPKRESQKVELRYSFERQGSAQKEDPSDLRIKLKKLTRQQEEEQADYKSKLRRLQKTISELNSEKNELAEKVDKLEKSKYKTEKMLKETLGKVNTGDNNMEIFEEVALVAKKVEYLEQQSDSRQKYMNQEHEPFKREIQRLVDVINEERLDKARVVQKKNNEIAYFKSEVDALMLEIQKQMNKKGNSTMKRNQAGIV